MTPALGALLGGAITGIGSLGASLIGNSGAKRRQREADARNIKFWNMENAYNHPTQQMKRLREAGLNPNLIYGESTAGATGQASSIAPSKAAPYKMSNFLGDGVQGLLSTSQAIKNNEDSKTTKGVRDSLIEIQKQQALQQAQKTDQEIIRTNIMDATQQDEIAKIQAQLRLAVANGNKAAQEAIAREYDNGIREKGFAPNTVGYLLANAFGFDTTTNSGRAQMFLTLGGLGLGKLAARLYGKSRVTSVISKKFKKNGKTITKSKSFNQQARWDQIWNNKKTNK